MTDEVYLKKLGEKIAKKRESLGLSREDLAEKVKISRMHVHRIEHGETHTTITVLRGIAKAFDISIGELVELN